VCFFSNLSFGSPGDSDGDGVNDFREGIDGTDANNPGSFDPLSRGLVACFMFSGSADDTSGYGNHGTSYGAVLSLDRLGMENNAYLFAGSSYIEIPNSSSLSFGMSDLTVSVWIKTTNPNFGFIYSDDGDTRRPGFEFSHSGAATYFEFSNQGIWAGLSNGENPVNNGEWRHLVLSFSRSIIRVYVDGKLDMERIPQPDWEQLGDISNSHPSRIGRNIFGFDNPFQGSIDDVRLYNRALTAQEINQLYETDAGNPDTDNDGVNDYREIKDGTDPNDPNSFNPLSKGLIAHYPFENTFEDQAQNNPPATPYNSDKVAFTQDPNLKRSVLRVTGEGFLGTNGGYVQIPRPNGLGTTATFSMNFLEIGYSHHHGQDFIHFADTSFGLVGHRHFRDEGIPGFFAMGTQINNELPSFTYNPSDDSVAINNPQWISYQVVISNGVSSIYRNGLLIAQVPGVVPTSGDIYLNYANWGDVSTRISASYSDVRIYNRSLSNVELAQLYIDSLGCLDSDNDGVTDAAEFLPDFAAVQLASGREHVTSNPSEFNLFTQSEYNANFTKGITQGRTDVISNPGDFGLFNDTSLADVNLGGVVMRKLGNAVNLEVQVQTTPDIKSQSFTNLPYKHLLYIDGLPTDKAFLRVRALGPQ
jgi:hypothetical protein